MSQNGLSPEEIERNQNAFLFKSDVVQTNTHAIWRLTDVRENWNLLLRGGHYTGTSNRGSPILGIEVNGFIVKFQFDMYEEERDFFVLVFRPIEVPPTVKHLKGVLLMEILDKDGNVWREQRVGDCASDWLNSKEDHVHNLYFHEMIIPRERLLSDEVLGEGDSLTIRIKFTKSRPRTLEYPNAVKLQNEASTAVDPLMSSHMEALFNDKGNADVQLKMKDGFVIRAHKLILSARSPVFRTMFEGNFIEKLGIVKIPDISSATMNVLLYYIYTGKLHSDWNNNVAEVLIGANKYDLQGIVHYCDYLMITLCNDFNAEDLLAIAKLHSLKRATRDLKKYIRGITM